MKLDNNDNINKKHDVHLNNMSLQLMYWCCKWYKLYQVAYYSRNIFFQYNAHWL